MKTIAAAVFSSIYRVSARNVPSSYFFYSISLVFLFHTLLILYSTSATAIAMSIFTLITWGWERLSAESTLMRLVLWRVKWR